MELIFSTTLTSAAPTISTGTLATGYKSLLIRGRLRCDLNSQSVSAILDFNSDTNANNYECTRLLYNGSSIGGAHFTGVHSSITPFGFSMMFANIPAGTATANRWAHVEITIIGHEDTDKYKNWASFSSGMPTTVNRWQQNVGGVWSNTDAITQIRLHSSPQTSGAASWIAGSKVQVYGLK